MIDWTQISEPSTLLTDYLLAAFCMIFAYKLKKNADQPLAHYWSWIFLAIAGSAICGGTFHSFYHFLNPVLIRWLWLATLYSLSLAAAFLLLSVHEKFKFKKYIKVLIGGKFFAFLFIYTFIDASFILAILDYGSALTICVYVIARSSLCSLHEKMMFFGGFLLSMIAAVVQQLQIVNLGFLNHNDIYHLIQLLALYFFFIYARRYKVGERS